MVRWLVCMCDVTTLNQQTCSKFRLSWTRSKVLVEMANLFDEIRCYYCCCCEWALHVNYHQHNYNRTLYIQKSHSGYRINRRMDVMLDGGLVYVCVYRVKRMKFKSREENGKCYAWQISRRCLIKRCACTYTICTPKEELVHCSFESYHIVEYNSSSDFIWNSCEWYQIQWIR